LKKAAATAAAFFMSKRPQKASEAVTNYTGTLLERRQTRHVIAASDKTPASQIAIVNWP
jgi:hypothetical protein